MFTVYGYMPRSKATNRWTSDKQGTPIECIWYPPTFVYFLNPDLGLKSNNLTEMRSLETYEKPLVNMLDKIEEELKVAASDVDAVKLVDFINAEKTGCQDVVNDLKDAKRRVSAEKRSQGLNKPRKAAVAEAAPVESDSEGSQSA